LDDELKAALTGHKNRYMLWIEIVKAYEKQEWMILRNIVGKLGLELKDLDQCYTESLKWTNKMIGQ
jgi:c-di-GMP-related signal transduction protein